MASRGGQSTKVILLSSPPRPRRSLLVNRPPTPAWWNRDTRHYNGRRTGKPIAAGKVRWGCCHAGQALGDGRCRSRLRSTGSRFATRTTSSHRCSPVAADGARSSFGSRPCVRSKPSPTVIRNSQSSDYSLESDSTARSPSRHTFSSNRTWRSGWPPSTSLPSPTRFERSTSTSGDVIRAKCSAGIAVVDRRTPRSRDCMRPYTQPASHSAGKPF